MGFLIVFLGGGLGAALRHGVNLTTARLLGTAFPYATLFENVTGSLVMGLLAGYFAFKGDASQEWRLFLTTGILGGYTTFSAFSLDAALLYERGELGLAALYVLASVALSIGGLFAGLALVRHSPDPHCARPETPPSFRVRFRTELGRTCDDDDVTCGDRVGNPDIADAAGRERLLRQGVDAAAAWTSRSATARAWRRPTASRAGRTAPPRTCWKAW